jgi:hypothetical protein
LSDVVFFIFSEKGTKSFDAVKRVVAAGIPAFTCQYSADKATDVNKGLFALGIPAHTGKTVGKFLESLGASTAAPPPFARHDPSVAQIAEDKPPYSTASKQLDLLPTSNVKRRADSPRSQ